MDKNPPANGGDTGLIPGPGRSQRRVASAHHKERKPGPATKTPCSQRASKKRQSLPGNISLLLSPLLSLGPHLPACLPSRLPSKQGWTFPECQSPQQFYTGMPGAWDWMWNCQCFCQDIGRWALSELQKERTAHSRVMVSAGNYYY